MEFTNNLSVTSVAHVARSWTDLVQRYPRMLWIGIGCQRGTSKPLIETAIWTVCQHHHLAASAIAGIATIDHKADEAGLVEFCQEQQLPLITFPREVLSLVKVSTRSTVVEKEVGTPSVAEAAAIIAANGSLLVTKQIFKPKNQLGAVTVAIAKSQLEYTDGI